ncbi:MAG TPA: hypothetical protein VF297_14725 [Pyrinomonadaceae bacterium]
MEDEDLNRIGKVEELNQSGADAEVVRQFASELEKELLDEATELMQAGQYEPALRKYLLATRLPDRAFRREALTGRALYALGFVLNNGKRFEDVECLRAPVFATIARELKERFENSDYRERAERRAHLDNQPLLLEKDFDALEVLDRDSPLPLTPDHFAARLRLAREKEAQAMLKRILDSLEEASAEPDAEKRRDIIEQQVPTLVEEAVEKAGAPYGGQIRAYVEEATNLLFVSQTEAVLNDISDGGTELRRGEFEQFERDVQAEADMVVALRAVVVAMKSFRGDELLPEVERVAAHWVEESATVRIKIMAARSPERARTVVNDSTRLINEERDALPASVAGGYREFLEGVAQRLGPPPEPACRVEPEPRQPPPPPAPAGLRGWLGRIFGRRS